LQKNNSIHLDLYSSLWRRRIFPLGPLFSCFILLPAWTAVPKHSFFNKTTPPVISRGLFGVVCRVSNVTFSSAWSSDDPPLNSLHPRLLRLTSGVAHFGDVSPLISLVWCEPRSPHTFLVLRTFTSLGLFPKDNPLSRPHRMSHFFCAPFCPFGCPSACCQALLSLNVDVLFLYLLFQSEICFVPALRFRFLSFRLHGPFRSTSQH